MVSTKTAKPAAKHDTQDGVEITGAGKYPLVPLMAIRIVERPIEGAETSKLFYNPRSLSGFSPDGMAQLQHSIRADGLQQPPIVRAAREGKTVTLVELIAGERRIRSFQAIYEQDLPCFDEDKSQPKHYKVGDVVVCRGRFGTVTSHEGGVVSIAFDDDIIGRKETKECAYADVFPTTSGRELYENIPCKVIYDCTDQRALRLAFTENDQSEPLSIVDEIALVERLDRMGIKQEEIAAILGTNVTWVSQTSNFRSQLPPEAFQLLLNGQMTRNVAVNFLSYAPEDRQRLFDASLAVEARESADRIKELKDEKDRLEDEEELAISSAKQAEKAGDDKTAQKEKRRATALANKAKKEAEKLERAKKEKGTLKQGHLKQGAAMAHLQPKKSKPLDKDELITIFVDGLVPYLEGAPDPVTGEKIPEEMLAMVRRTVLAINSGIRDPIQPIREYMYDSEQWQRPHPSDGDGLDNEATDFDVPCDDGDFVDAFDD